MYDTLKGITVVETAGYLCVPTAAAVLADWGADVVKIEHPVAGDPYRGLRNDFVRPGQINPMLELPNRGKRSFGLDVSVEEGREILLSLVRDADVFLTSFRPRTLAHLRLEFADLRKVNPRLVYAKATGYGSRGPEAGRPGFDLAATWARAGLMHRMTMPGAAEPADQPGSLGDLTGGLTLAGGVAAGLVKRDRTGEGTELEVSLYHVGMWFMAQSIGAAQLGLVPRPGERTRTNVANPVVNSYRTKDDRWLVLCLLQPDPLWPDFCEHIGRPQWATDPRFDSIDTRAEHAVELIALLDEVFAQRTLADWRTALQTLRGVWAPALDPYEVAADEQALANGFLTDVALPDGGSYQAVASPVQFGGQPIGALTAMPEHAQHTEEILLSLGRDWEDIIRLKDAGVVT